jgi:arylsulfatase A-like enzyme
MPLNILFLVIDSLRAASLTKAGSHPRTPFFDRLDHEMTSFRRAYAAECWTLPSHVSMFTGLLPSVHGAHFQHMGYTGASPTIAEIVAEKGYHTEIVTRNFMFDGTMPGITRGFQVNTQLLSELKALHPFNWILALTRSRSRRLVRETGFFHPRHHDSREFLARYSRSMIPADELCLEHLARRMRELRDRRPRTPFFLFCNLYDVHWPYPPAVDSVLAPLSSPQGWIDNAMLPFVLPSIGSHGYLRPKFHLSHRSRDFLLRRYHRAIELMDQKLARFFGDANASLLDDTLVIVTSDHGEGFGEHGLYLHDASVYDTHLHVPLWIHHPGCNAAVVDDLVTTRDLFGLMRSAADGKSYRGTILDAEYRAANAIALAEHFHYTRVPDMLPRYRQNIGAAICDGEKIVVRREGLQRYDLQADPGEAHPQPADVEAIGAQWRAATAATNHSAALTWLRHWDAARRQPPQ